MKRRRRSTGSTFAFWGLAVAIVAASALVLAQDEIEYPHGEFEDDCETCHSPDRWVPAVIGPDFEHPSRVFPLVGAHETAPCRGCHESLEFAKAPSECVSCHLDVHQGELGADCGRCHTPRSFIDRAEMVRAHVMTRFPLRGAHLPVDCEDCHSRSQPGQYRFVNTPTRCVECHIEAYAGATEPDHQANAFPTDCALCHRPTSWDFGEFSHAGVTAPCESCHLEDHRATTAPDHVAQGFPTTCAACHATTGWVPANFDHSSITTACSSCHLDEYTATRDPDHQTAGYPTTCESCHTSTTSWNQATDVNHDGLHFPIYSGAHANRWNACSDCHTSPGSFSSFNCFGCHPHSDRDKTDADHGQVSGYTYDSQACYSCHPGGRS